MCGRFVSARRRLELLEEFAATRDKAGAERNADYNVAPTKRIYAVMERPSGEAPAGPWPATRPAKPGRPRTSAS